MARSRITRRANGLPPYAVKEGGKLYWNGVSGIPGNGEWVTVEEAPMDPDDDSEIICRTNGGRKVICFLDELSSKAPYVDESDDFLNDGISNRRIARRRRIAAEDFDSDISKYLPHGDGFGGEWSFELAGHGKIYAFNSWEYKTDEGKVLGNIPFKCTFDSEGKLLKLEIDPDKTVANGKLRTEIIQNELSIGDLGETETRDEFGNRKKVKLTQDQKDNRAYFKMFGESSFIGALEITYETVEELVENEISKNREKFSEAIKAYIRKYGFDKFTDNSISELKPGELSKAVGAAPTNDFDLLRKNLISNGWSVKQAKTIKDFLQGMCIAIADMDAHLGQKKYDFGKIAQGYWDAAKYCATVLSDFSDSKAWQEYFKNAWSVLKKADAKGMA